MLETRLNPLGIPGLALGFLSFIVCLMVVSMGIGCIDNSGNKTYSHGGASGDGATGGADGSAVDDAGGDASADEPAADAASSDTPAGDVAGDHVSMDVAPRDAVASDVSHDGADH
jgi:hypothetical protein